MKMYNPKNKVVVRSYASGIKVMFVNGKEILLDKGPNWNQRMIPERTLKLILSELS